MTEQKLHWDLPFEPDASDEKRVTGHESRATDGDPIDGPEVLVFKALKCRKCFVTLTIHRDPAGGMRADYAWEVGNYQGKGCTDDGLRGRAMVLDTARVCVLTSLEACEIVGSAGHVRSYSSRRSDVMSQFEEWIEGLIEIEETSQQKQTDTTSDEHA